MKIDLELLNKQLAWLLAQPRCDEADGLVHLCEALIDEGLSQPPALKSDDKYPPSEETLFERRIVWNLLHHLASAGLVLECVDDGGDELIRYSSELEDIRLQVMEDIFAVEEARVLFKGGPWVLLVMGNGEDIIADYTMSIDKVMMEFDPKEYR